MKLDFNNPETNPLPEQVQDLVANLLEGRVVNLAIIAEISDPDGETSWIEGVDLGMEEHVTSGRAFLGALQLMVKAVADDLLPPSIRISFSNGESDGDQDDN